LGVIQSAAQAKNPALVSDQALLDRQAAWLTGITKQRGCKRASILAFART